MFIEHIPVESVEEIQPGIFLLTAFSPNIAQNSKPGQFCNIKVSESSFPLLRRPFSICDSEGDYISFMFNVYGEGTKLLSHKQKGETIDVLGPLGNGFNLEGDYDQTVIVAGGLGSAPFPYLMRKLNPRSVISFVGGRTQKDVIKYKLANTHIATDDGSEGLMGNVIQLMELKTADLQKEKSRIFACGPNAMLRALKEFSIKNGLECYASTECAMACGFGICQGCPIEKSDKSGYELVCKDGPFFNVMDVII